MVGEPAAHSSRARSASEPSPSARPVQPGQDWDRFVNVRGKKSARRRHVGSEPLHVYNRFSPLRDTPAEPDTLVIGSSIVRDVKLPAVSVRCYPGARVGDIEGQSEVLKLQVGAVCELAKSMSDTVIYSGPLPNLVNDEMYSRLSSFNCWLSRYCREHSVVYVDNWCAFWGKPGLIRRDGRHPTLDGASLLARNLAASFSHPN